VPTGRRAKLPTRAKDLVERRARRWINSTDSTSVPTMDLAVSTFALDHPLPRFDRSREQTSGAPGGGGRDERWTKFVGSISRLESFSSKRLTKKFVAKV